MEFKVVKHALGGYSVEIDGKLLGGIFRLKNDATKHMRNLKKVADAMEKKCKHAVKSDNELNLNLVEFTPPSRQQINIKAKKWFSELNGVKFSDWNKHLLQYTYPIEYVTLSKEELIWFVNGGAKELGESIIEKISTAMARLKKQGYNSFFVKLVSRSPKDWLVREDNTMMKINSPEDVVHAFGSSFRCLEDIVMLSHLNIDNNLIIRPYIQINPETEWRCFIKNNQVIGISRYYYQKENNIKNPSSIKTKIVQFLEEVVIPNITVSDFVADVISDQIVILLETNPYGLSDPCLFGSYSELESGNFNIPKFLF